MLQLPPVKHFAILTKHYRFSSKNIQCSICQQGVMQILWAEQGKYKFLTSKPSKEMWLIR